MVLAGGFVTTDCVTTSARMKYYHILILPSVCLCALTLYPATDCAAATDISGVSGRWQLSR